jgi:hypothetical protein
LTPSVWRAYIGPAMDTNTLLNSNPEEHLLLKQSFSELLLEFTKILNSVEIQIVPFREENWKKFFTVPAPQLHAIYCGFKSYCDLYASAIEEGENIRDDKALLWRTITKLGLRPCSDLMEHIEKNDVVEIYDKNYVQLYRNLRFFELCSYTLLELLTNEWFMLYRRPASITTAMIASVDDVMSGKWRTTKVNVEIPEHFLEEIFSEECNVFKVTQKIQSPLFGKNNSPEAIVGVLHAEPIGNLKTLNRPLEV